MTAKEFRSDSIFIDEGFTNYEIEQIEKLMELYAQQESIAFAEWISNHKLDFQPASDGRFIGLDMVYYTAEQLYKEFKTLND